MTIERFLFVRFLLKFLYFQITFSNTLIAKTSAAISHWVGQNIIRIRQGNTAFPISVLDVCWGFINLWAYSRCRIEFRMVLDKLAGQISPPDFMIVDNKKTNILSRIHPIFLIKKKLQMRAWRKAKLISGKSHEQLLNYRFIRTIYLT